VPPKSTKWKTVADESVRLVWQCENDDCDEQPCVNVGPDFSKESGNPVCSCCDEEMNYIRTEVKQ
jgi:hypothetical protein